MPGAIHQTYTNGHDHEFMIIDQFILDLFILLRLVIVIAMNQVVMNQAQGLLGNCATEGHRGHQVQSLSKDQLRDHPLLILPPSVPCDPRDSLGPRYHAQQNPKYRVSIAHYPLVHVIV